MKNPEIKLWTIETGQLHEDLALDSDKPQWLHFNYKNSLARDWVKQHITISDGSFHLLTAEDTRPRCLHEDNSIFVSLRGINLNQNANPEDMISIRIWVCNNLVITSNNRHSQSIKRVLEMLGDNSQLSSAEDVLLNLIAQSSSIADKFIEQIENKIDIEEDNIAKARFEEFNPKMSHLRRQIATIRRFLAPQREALEKLYRNKVASFSIEFYDELYLYLDKSMLLLESLDLIRERILVLQEQFMGLISHQQNSRLYLLAIISAIFLPLTFLSGLLGMNVGGLPGLDSAVAFWWVTGFCVLVAIVLLLWFKKKHWF